MFYKKATTSTSVTVRTTRAHEGHQIASSTRIVGPSAFLQVDKAYPAYKKWIGKLSKTIATYCSYLLKQREIRRSISALSEFDDRMLQDIGIGRWEIERAVLFGTNRWEWLE